MKKRFVTFFPEGVNAELIKDVGMIPYLLKKNKGYDASFVSRKKKEDLSYAFDLMKELEIDTIEKKYKKDLLNSLSYLRKNSKQIDILNIYHFGLTEALIYAYVYKRINKGGIAYLKLDIDYKGIQKLKTESSWKIKLRKKLLDSVDIITAESASCCGIMADLLGRTVQFIPNGYYDFDVIEKQGIKRISKEKMILFVGRIGAEQKNTELLVDAFTQLHIADWTLQLVGGYTDEFKCYLDDITEKNRDSKIILSGNVSDRDQLSEIYQKASIFVLPSRWESFGIVLIEALRHQCYCIVSDQVPSAFDLINEENGCIFPSEDIEKLKAEMHKATNNMEKNKGVFHEYETYSWNHIIDELDKLIIKEMNKRGKV